MKIHKSIVVIYALLINIFVNVFVQEKSTALEGACRNGHDEVMMVLIASKATVNTQNKVRSTI